MRLIFKIFLFFAILLPGLDLTAQSLLPTPVNINAAYLKNTRSVSGLPGKNYWQNSADYALNIQIDPATRAISGKAQIEYVNNSTDTLKELVFKLYPNIFKKGSPRLMKINDADASDGLIIESININGTAIPVSALLIDGTNMMVRITPLTPKKTISIVIQYKYTLNKNSHIRTGQVDDGAFFIAYFFPRIAVYDDIDGWNRFPYLGTQEFYNDFCTFKLNITAPSDYMVWATGDLQNCAAVYTEKYCNRIRKAETGDEIFFIIDSSDLANGSITNKSNATNTWQFVANNVTDIAFAISNHYVWQSSSVEVDHQTKRRTRVDAVFNPNHKDYFFVAEDARKTVAAMSDVFPKWPFPYAHETVFDGLDQMEYPMMVNDNPVENRAESIELTDHEIFHTMFPFYMGINETKYGWMDEGWATIGEWIISPIIDSTIKDAYGIQPTAQTAGTEIDLPVTTLTTQLNGISMFINSYPKPAFGYLFVKDYLGDELFFKALHFYIKNWNGKHPMPNDFFYAMNKGSGKNLNWFWEKWFFGGGILDLAITSVNNNKITISNNGTKPLPIDLKITFADGSTEHQHKSIGVWEKGNTTVVLSTTSGKKITKAEFDGFYFPDSNKSNNVWVIK